MTTSNFWNYYDYKRQSPFGASGRVRSFIFACAETAFDNWNWTFRLWWWYLNKTGQVE